MEIYLDSHGMRWRRGCGAMRCSISPESFSRSAGKGSVASTSVNDQGQDETIYLKPLKNLLDQGKCPADLVVEKWQGELDHDIKKLIAYSAYKLP